MDGSGDRDVMPRPEAGDLSNPFLIHLKGVLFLVIALLTAFLLILLTMDVKVAALLALCVWASCRLYYYAFYVIERYVDPTFRFAGLWSVATYLLRRKRD